MRKYTAETPFEDVLNENGICISARAISCLKRVGVENICDFMSISENNLRDINHLGRKGVEEVVGARKMLKGIHILTAEEIRKNARKRAQEDIKLLNKFIGLEDVKFQVNRLIALAKLQQYMKNQGANYERMSLNMEFVGNPGTAKTSVARILAKIFYDFGLIPGDKLFEVGRADLIGEYTGHTAAKVKRLFNEAKGNVIFIDEAYSLVDSERGSYGDEAISTIVKEMEDNREDTIVIFAGYPKEMETFMARNAGLRSRVPYRIEFKDYSAEEMSLISKSLAKGKGFSIEPKAVAKIKEMYSQTSTSSGNGRLCRNMVENAMMSFAMRHFDDMDDPSGKIRFILKAEDFNMPVSVGAKNTEVHPIGFCAEF